MAMKTRAYLGAGAVEVWIVDDTGALQVEGASGAQPVNRFGVTLALC